VSDEALFTQMIRDGAKEDGVDVVDVDLSAFDVEEVGLSQSSEDGAGPILGDACDERELVEVEATGCDEEAKVEETFDGHVGDEVGLERVKGRDLDGVVVEVLNGAKPIENGEVNVAGAVADEIVKEVLSVLFFAGALPSFGETCLGSVLGRRQEFFTRADKVELVARDIVSGLDDGADTGDIEAFERDLLGEVICGGKNRFEEAQGIAVDGDDPEEHVAGFRDEEKKFLQTFEAIEGAYIKVVEALDDDNASRACVAKASAQAVEVRGVFPEEFTDGRRELSFVSDGVGDAKSKDGQSWIKYSDGVFNEAGFSDPRFAIDEDAGRELFLKTSKSML